MSGLDFEADEETATEQTRTNIELFNPQNSWDRINYVDDMQLAQAYFEAANRAKHYPVSREKLTGELLLGVQRAREGGDHEYLVERVEEVTGVELEIVTDE